MEGLGRGMGVKGTEVLTTDGTDLTDKGRGIVSV
jgi:hypothetical protein